MPFYNLDVAISVGYRVKSIAGTRFRQWATKVLRAILLEGVKRDYRLEALENRVALNESGLQRVEEGLNYLVEQMSAPTMKRVTGFSKEGIENGTAQNRASRQLVTALWDDSVKFYIIQA